MLTPQRKLSTESGQFPRFDPHAQPLSEPRQPPTLPELEEPHGATGVINIVSEGLDDAEDADDPGVAR